MPFFLSFRRKRAATSTTHSSVATSVDNSTAVHTAENNTNSCKRKKLSTLSTLAINSKAKCEFGGDISNYRRWDTYPHDEPPSISSLLWQLSEEDKIIKFADYVGISGHEPFLNQQDECDVGHGRQRNYMDACSTAYNALEEHYVRLGDDRGLVELQQDVACFRVSIDSDTNTKYEEVTSAAASNNSIVEDVGDFSFDNGGNESIGDELGELRNGIPADGTPLIFDRAPNGGESGKDVVAFVGGDDEDTAQDAGDISIDIGSNEFELVGTTPTVTSHTNTSHATDEEADKGDNANLKLDSIKCVERVDNKRNEPSPTDATANLSSFTNTSPASYDDGNEDALPSFNDDGVVSPKKGKAMCFVCCIFNIYPVLFDISQSPYYYYINQSIQQKIHDHNRRPAVI